MQIPGYLLARFSEPSSYAGLGALLALVGFHSPDTLTGQLAQFLAAGCALAALVLKERGLIRGLALAVGLAAAPRLPARPGSTRTAPNPAPARTRAPDAAPASAPLVRPSAVWSERA